MLIRIHHDAELACEHGILKSESAQAFADAQRASKDMSTRAEALLAHAQVQADDIVNSAMHHAEEVGMQAQAQAKQLFADAQKMLEQVRQQAYDAGQRAAAKEWHARHAALAERHAASLAAMNERLAAVVTTAVERVIAEAPRAALFERALKHVQTLTRGASTLVLRVHPNDQEAADESLAALRDSGALSIEVAPDATLAPGSCIFESELGVLDASLDVQLEALRAVMERAVRSVTVEAPPDATPAGETQAEPPPGEPEPDEPDEHDEPDEQDEHGAPQATDAGLDDQVETGDIDDAEANH